MRLVPLVALTLAAAIFAYAFSLSEGLRGVAETLLEIAGAVVYRVGPFFLLALLVVAGGRFYRRILRL